MSKNIRSPKNKKSAKNIIGFQKLLLFRLRQEVTLYVCPSVRPSVCDILEFFTLLKRKILVAFFCYDSTQPTYIFCNYLGTLGSCSNLSCRYDSLSIGNNDADCFSSLDLIQLFAELCGLLHKVLVPSKYLSGVLSVESDISILLTTSTMGCIHNTMKNFCRLYFQEKQK